MSLHPLSAPRTRNGAAASHQPGTLEGPEQASQVTQEEPHAGRMHCTCQLPGLNAQGPASSEGLEPNNSLQEGQPWCLSGKEAAYTAGDSGLTPGLGRSPGEGHGNPLQYSCLENPTDRGAWWATVHGVAKSQT